MTSYIRQQDRGFITISGDDRFEFLQGLISNDVEKCREGKVIWAALLTPQGKYLYDFFVFERETTLVIDCVKDQLMEIGQLLRKFQLRSKIQMGIDQKSDALLFPDCIEGIVSSLARDQQLIMIEQGILYLDPRDAKLGWRFVGDVAALLDLIAKQDFHEIDLNIYEARRIELGIPEGHQDIEQGKGLLLEYGFDELGGVDWKKGCFMGQELTARTKYRALIKKRLLKVHFPDGLPSEELRNGDDFVVNDVIIGTFRSIQKKQALAFIRLDRLEKVMEKQSMLMMGQTAVEILYPDYMKS